MIYKVDFEGQACKQIKEKAESYQYDLKSVLKGIGLLIADMWLPGDSKPQINTWEGLFEKVQEDYSYKDTIVENDFICSISNDDGISIIIEIADETIVDFKDIKSSILQVRDFLLANKWSGAIPDFLPIEQKEIRNMMNETERSIPFKCLHEAFFECAYRFPDKTALEWLSLDEKWETLSYEALKIKVLQTASMLKQEGVHTRDKVAIVLPKGENQIIAVLAILSIGATYVPIGIHQPLDRKKKIFEAGNISYALTDRDHINTLDGADTLRSFLIENSFRYVVMPETEIVKDIDSIAYIIFTSGTTGIPNQIEYAIRKEVSRHDALRTIFYKNGRQKILNNVPDYSVIVTKCQNDEEKEIELQKQRKILSHKVYDHEKWPLFTFQMIESPNSRILMVSLDLMVCDGDSMQILFTEIADTLEGKSDAEKIEYSYAEYIQNISNQKNSESYEEDKAYWLNKIDSLSSYPQIPMKMKLADCRDYNIVRKSAIIDSVLWGNFKETARRHKVSPSALLCTLYGRIMAKWGNQSEVLLNLTVFQRQQKNTEKIIGDFTKLLPLNLVFAKEDIWKSAERVQEQIMKELDHLSFDGTEIMRELAKRRGVFGKALLPVVFTCVLFDCPENYFERLGSIKYAVSQTPQVFLDNQITEMGGRLHISWDVVDELFEACIIDEIFLEFVEDIKRISENNKANSTNDFVTKVWGNILTKEIITKSVVPDLLKNIDLKQIKILDYAQELCPPDVKGQVYVSESEIMNDRNKTYYKILEHPLYGRMADTGIIGVLTHDGYMEFVVPNCETSVETPDKKEDTHEEEIEKPIVKEIMKIWKEVFEIEDISIQDDFYTLGGDSIILMRLVDEMCKTLGCDVTVDDILQSENISDLANRV